jgi:type VI secretion system VasD/TssJ family lipoprotein
MIETMTDLRGKGRTHPSVSPPTPMGKQGAMAPGARWRPLVLAAVGLALSGLSGCGILFSKQEKPMRVEVVFTGGDSLNFDGRSVQAVQVKAYVLRKVERFSAADVRAFFNPDFDPGFMAEFAKDTLGSVTMIVAPGETRGGTIEIPFIRARDASPQLGVITKFAQPPNVRGRERVVFKIPQKTQQTVHINLGKNWVERGKK